jgi:hypothetical protein
MAYGYVGDLTPDSNSLRGIGAFAHTSKPGSLVPNFSAALTDEYAAKLGIKPGDTFQHNGSTYRYDDRQPSGLGHNDFVDVYTPNRPPDAGVSPAEIARQAAIAKGNPNTPVYSLGSGLSHLAPQQGSGPGFPSWFKKATDDDVSMFDNYANGGGDLTKIPVEDQLAVAIKKDPEFLLRPENIDAFKEFVAKPQDEQFNPVDSVVQALWNLPGGIIKSGQDAGKALLNTWNVDKDSSMMLIKRATGWSPDGRSMGQLRTDRAQEIANMSGGIGDLGQDLQAAGEGAYLMGLRGTNAAIQASGLDQATKDSANQGLLEARQGFARDMYHASQYGINIQNLISNAYKATGLMDKTAEDVKNAKIDPDAASGYSNIAQIVGTEGVGALASGALRIIKPTFFEQALNKTEKFIDASGDANAVKAAASVDPGLNTAASAAQANRTQVLNDLQSTEQGVGSNMGKDSAFDISKPILQVAGSGMKFVSKIPDAIPWLSEKLSFGNPIIQSVVEKGLTGVLGLTGLEHLGMAGTAATLLGVASGKALLENIGELTTAMGKEGFQARSFIPYWQRVARQTEGIPRNIALSLDRPLVYALGDAAKGAGAGMTVGGVLGGVSNPDDPIQGAIGGMGFGGVFGMVGGGFGQIIGRSDPNQLKANFVGDWKRYRDVLSPSEKQQFDSLPARIQLSMGTFMAQYPGIKVNFFNDPEGIGGKHTVNADGTSSIFLNTAANKTTIAPLLAHELGHQAAFNGILPDIYDSLLGNSDTGKIGQYTQLGSDGRPTGVDPETGRYNTNSTWDALKSEYINKVSGLNDEKGQPVDVSHLSDTQLAKEIYAEHQAQYLLSGNHIVDTLSAANPYYTGRGSQIKEALMSLGVGFTPTGEIVRGAGVFDNGVTENKELNGLAKNYYSTKIREGSIESEDAITHKVTDENLRDPNVRATILDSAPEFMRDKEGNVLTNSGGRPILRTRGEVQKISNNMGAAMDRAVENLSPEQRNEINLQQTGKNTYTMRYMPDDVLDSTLKENQNNLNQASNLRLINSGLADVDKQGTTYSMFYHKATQNGRYGQFAGQYRDLTPYLIEKTQHGNINLKGVEFDQLINNYLKLQNRPGIKGIWDSPGDFIKDSHTYFSNHADNLPGETNIGVTKRDALNVLTGVNKSGNPLKDTIGAKAKAIVKSFRIDRINRVRDTGAIQPFRDESQYQKIATNYAPQSQENIEKSEEKP